MAKSKKSQKSDPLREQAEAFDGTYPEPWIPASAGDMIVGEVVRLTTGMDTQYRGGRYPIVVVHDEETDEDRSIHVFGTQMVSAFAEAQENGMRPGVRIAVKYVGEKKNRAGTYSYKVYGVFVDPEAKASADTGLDFAEFRDGDEPVDPEDDLPF